MINKFRLLILVIFIFHFTYGQKKIYVRDSITKEKLKNIQIIVNGDVFYTNDDGATILPETNADIQLSSTTYKNKKLKLLQDTILLNPIYKNIDEVILQKNIDIKNLIDQTLINYRKIYFTNKSNFFTNIKQKACIDGKLQNILVGDLNIWTKNTVYDFGKNKLVDFLQINLNDIKYYKSESKKRNSIFNDIQLSPDDFVTKLFLNNELNSIKNETNIAETKVTGRLMYEDNYYKKINFVFSLPNADCTGFLLYDKSDQAITYFEVFGKINTLNISKKRNNVGKDYLTKTESFYISFDFYKKNGKYFPARTIIKADGENMMDNKNHPFTFEQELIYNKSKEGNDSGLKIKIDLSKNLTDNIPTKEETGSKILLSAEEQKFVDER